MLGPVCGDGAIQTGEECDGTINEQHCVFCLCEAGYIPTTPVSVGCELAPEEAQTGGPSIPMNDLTIYITFGVAGLMALILIFLIIIIAARNYQRNAAARHGALQEMGEED